MIVPHFRPGPRVVALSVIGALLTSTATVVPATGRDEPASVRPEASVPVALAPDARAELARQRLTDVKRQVRAALGDACPGSADAWPGWLDNMLALAASLIAVGDLDGPLKKSGASLEQLRAFDDAKGSAVNQLVAADAAIGKIHDCAAALGRPAPPTPELIERVYDRADVLKEREETALGLAELYRPIKRPSARERQFF